MPAAMFPSIVTTKPRSPEGVAGGDGPRVDFSTVLGGMTFIVFTLESTWPPFRSAVVCVVGDVSGVFVVL